MADNRNGNPWYRHRNAPPPGAPTPDRPRQPAPRRAPPQGENRGGQEWWQDPRVPKQWQDQTEPGPPRPRQKPPAGQGSADAYSGARPEERERMLRGAFQAGVNGDDGALQSFPNDPFGQRLRQEFMRGRQQRQRPNRGLGFAVMDRS